MKIHASTLITSASILLISAGAASAQLVYTAGHADIGIAYEDGELEPHWHVGSGAMVDGSPLATEEEYAPSELIAQVSSVRTSPSGLSSGIGVADGTEIYTAGTAGYQPNLGFGAEELSPSDWIGSITLTLTGWSTPSGENISLYTMNLANTSVADIAFSSFNSGSTFDNNSVTFLPGDHFHLNWGFTDLGNFDVTFKWTGEHVTDGIVSAEQTFSLQVVPEPAQTTAIAMVVAAVGAVACRRRRSPQKASV
ncbi:choice-of-anchor M domain-containing protein [Puniceicoccus vermicola]|uniref:PEP-CTERM sorting domain-containing protein n=1 Tax=Puniceicoccus vermicola TaxID=388746 RepID=A0A7X1E5V9_9BACT|nr:choice-of-anchor M domain-containing protein [Puniceicoccus vermicola]MBC2603483.1 PEP-CTERM sorting domain-containing protein [Puniceicoccus vermicola]